ncbi:nascent polypeptide-associated complex protein [Natronosalvus halobius]|uniref:nascent polypeptide-associated complex protein n=1 Tax=Natronosalvus halobius TaxID=2953746 RepID=UPI00209F8D37|nr:nascent polypeptide-associated complex protein [Natronosalvus halobius]USZ71339.1 nascent polypeptide-associated complex protein [Natronosalvus halobius]
MFGGGGGLNPRKMEQMMKQMGIDVDELDAEEVIIRTADHDLVFTDADVTKMDARGQETYQVIGTPEERERGSAGDAGGADADETDADADSESAIPDSDIEIVAARTGVSDDEAREALEAENGDLAAAVERLE